MGLDAFRDPPPYILISFGRLRVRRNVVCRLDEIPRARRSSYFKDLSVKLCFCSITANIELYSQEDF